MKKLFTLLFAMITTMAINAQPEIDTSGWSVGDNVSGQLGWADYDGTTNNGAWKGTGAAYSANEWENYQVSNIDRYQFVYLPAGVYSFKAQAFHRYGGQNEAANLFFNNGSSSHAYLYADVISADSIDTADSTNVVSYTVGKTWQTAIRSNWSEKSETQVYSTSDWQSDSQYTFDNVVYYAPNSMNGARAYFDLDLLWNEVKVIVKEGSYVKLGIRREGTNVSSEWVLYTNFQLWYEGNAGEAVEIELALDGLYAAQTKVDELADKINKTYPALGNMLSDAAMELEYDNSNADSIAAATKKVEALIADYQVIYSDAKSLTALITTVNTLISTTNYSGKTALEEAVSTAQKVAEATELDNISAYTTAKQDLLTARVTYILSQEIGDEGYCDFTSAISKPWICNEEYNPTFNTETGHWSMNEEVLNSGWSSLGDVGYAGSISSNSSLVAISSDVVLGTDTTVTNQWYLTHKYTAGYIGEYETYWNDYLPCAKAWGTPLTGYYDMRQNLTGLPNGFYTLKALAQTWSNDWTTENPCSNHIYAQTANSKVESPVVALGGWWGNDVSQWLELATDFIQVTDGNLLIASRANGFSAYTGFRLTYYGNNPDFSAMIQKKLDDVNNSLSANLTFPGDIANAKAMISNIVMPIQNLETYQEALDSIKMAENYISTAYSYLNSWNLIDQIVALQADYAETDTVYTILNNYFNTVLNIGAGENDTYKTAQEASDDFTALKNYIAYRATVTPYAILNSEISTIIARHNTTLISTYLTATDIAALTAELEAAYNEAIVAQNAATLIALGIDKATLTNPIDITTIVKNPSFDDSKNGWTDTENNLVVDSNLHNAERWNANFNYSQTIVSLPAGCYKLQVQAFYRDGNTVETDTVTGNITGGAYYNWWYAAGSDVDLWTTKHAELYVKSDSAERTSYIKSVAGELFTQPSYNKYVSSLVEGDVATDENGNIIYDENNNEVMLYDTVWAELDVESPVYPFDAKVTDGENVYWYPNSMTGANYRFNLNPEAYQNEVSIMLEEGENLTIGIRKATTISNDWCIFDNFKLYYLGKDTPTAINTAETSNSTASKIYNVGGVRMSNMQKGINIIKMTDGTTRKVLIR